MKRTSHPRPVQDHVGQELLTALLERKSYDDFSELFAVIHQRLRSLGKFGGGEEMLRLRVYEKLQSLVGKGLVKRAGKTYTANPDPLKAHVLKLEAALAKAEERKKALVTPK